MSLSPGVDGAACLVIIGSFAMMVVRWYNGIRPLPPLRLLSRSIDYLRAGSLLVGEMARGAWARRTRWQECLQRARLER